MGEKDFRSYALVSVQVAAQAALAWPGRARWRLPAPVTALATAAAAGGALTFAAAARELGGDLRANVEPPAGAELHTGGLYRFSRHPIYAGLLTGAVGVAVLRRRVEPLLATGLLAAVFQLKSVEEERRLARRFGQHYLDYAARTPRLLGPPAGRRLAG